jgi:hypothetical protein
MNLYLLLYLLRSADICWPVYDQRFIRSRPRFIVKFLIIFAHTYVCFFFKKFILGFVPPPPGPSPPPPDFGPALTARPPRFWPRPYCSPPQIFGPTYNLSLQIFRPCNMPVIYIFKEKRFFQLELRLK